MKRGNAAPNMDRMKLFEPNALAATGRYAETRKVKTEMKTSVVPKPKGTPARTVGAQWTDGWDVHANQYNPIGLLSGVSLRRRDERGKRRT